MSDVLKRINKGAAVGDLEFEIERLQIENKVAWNTCNEAETKVRHLQSRIELLEAALGRIAGGDYDTRVIGIAVNALAAESDLNESLEEWRLRVYGKELNDEIKYARNHRDEWRRGSRKSKHRPNVWIIPLILLVAIFITALFGLGG